MAPKAPAVRWDAFEAVSKWPPAAAPFISQGHAPGRYKVEVRVSPEAWEAYAALVAGGSVPVGTLVAKLHEDRQDGAAGPIYAMHKLGDGRWEFIVAEPTGELRERGQLERCVRCHAEGVTDNLFGLPGRPRAPDAPPKGD